jgi:hypothetical protein
MTGPDGAVRDRRVALVLGALVLGVLAINVVSGLVPELDDVVSSVPVVVLILVAGTVGVLAWSVGRGRRR